MLLKIAQSDARKCLFVISFSTGELEQQMLVYAILWDKVVNQRLVTVLGTYIHIQKNKIDLVPNYNSVRAIVMELEDLYNWDQAFGL